MLHNFCTVPPRPQVEKEDYVLYFGRYDKEKGIDTLLAGSQGRCLSCTLCSPAAVPWQRKFSNCPMPQM